MHRKQVYRGTVKTGIGGAVAEMSKPGSLEEFRRLFGIPVIPGTLNIERTEPFDLSLLKYVKFSDIGWEFDPATQGIQHKGEIGMHYGPITIARKYRGFLVFFTWVRHKDLDGELISPHHLRTTLGLQDGDAIEFTLADPK